MQELYAYKINSPIGKLLLIASDSVLKKINFEVDQSVDDPDIIQRQNSIVLQTERQLKEYFQGKRKVFSVPLSAVGTDFQKKTWSKLMEIPYGQTISYQELAIQMGAAGKARAVGSANGRNPIPVIIPCHRVIAKDGTLGGYGGGLAVKEFLLKLESRNN